MILSVGAFVRVGALLLVAVVLQLSALSQLDLFGGSPDLVVLVVAAVAYYGGSLSGCATGFSAGLLLEHVESGRRVTENTLVVTSGFTSSRTESLFPRGIPIGRVTKVDLD